MNVLSCKNAKIKIVRPCPYATLNPFGNVNVMFLFWLHQYFSPTLFPDWNVMRICVIVNTTLREPRGCGDVCGWGEGVRGVGARVGAWLRPPRWLASGRYASCWNADLFTVSSDRHTPLTYQQNLRVDGLYGKVGSFSSCSLHIELVMWISAKPINVFCG